TLRSRSIPIGPAAALPRIRAPEGARAPERVLAEAERVQVSARPGAPLRAASPCRRPRLRPHPFQRAAPRGSAEPALRVWHHRPAPPRGAEVRSALAE